MNKIMMKKYIQFLILITLISSSNSFANRKLEDGEEVDIRHCGDFVVKADLGEFENPMVCRTDDVMDRKQRKAKNDWKTPEATVELHVSKSDLTKAKTPKQMMDHILLEMIREKVKAKLKAFAWIGAAEMYGEQDPSIAKKSKAVAEKYEELQKELLADEGKGPKHEVQKLLTLYPDIEDEILTSHPDYKPLICKYQLHQHRAQHLKTAGKILGITATIVSLVGGPATAYFWIPALPKVLLIAGGANVVAGSLKISSAIMKWDDVRAANTAKALIEFNEQNIKIIEKLKRNPENKEMVEYLEKQKLKPEELKKLKNVKKLKRKEYALFFSGIMNTTMGAASIYGGIWAQNKFGEFKATEPANVSQPYTPPTGGSTTGGGATGGGWAGQDDGG